jgi:galactose mutarotase-like enzyme
MKINALTKYFLVITILFLFVSCTSKVKKEGNTKVKESTPKFETKLVHTLKNHVLTVAIKTTGAELASIKSNGLEYVWQADPEVWPRHAPILFPIVGPLNDHEYKFMGKVYKMPQHGFARDHDFVVIEKTPTNIVFEQRATESSKSIYPFDFVLQVRYTLKEKSLITEYSVSNPSETEDLYFSIGAHPAFNAPFEENQKRNEYELIFDTVLPPTSLDKMDELITDNYSVLNEAGVISLADNIFDKGALIFNPNPFSKVSFVHKPTQKAYMSVLFKNYPYLGIWSMNNAAKFVCIEPWHGIKDSKNHNKEFTQKEGVKKLVARENFSCSFTVDIL